MVEKRWELRDQSGDVVGAADEVIERLLVGRGLSSPAEIDEFLHPLPPAEIPLEKFGIAPEALEKAVGLVSLAVDRESPIIIHGDFDIDGLGAVAVLWETVYRGLGYPKCWPFIPNRFRHGYGLTRASVDEIIRDSRFAIHSPDSPLLITVDCGITAHEAIEYAKSQGFQVLITDHHQPEGPVGKDDPDRFEGDGLLWTDQLCGAGIAWVLAQGLKQRFSLAEGRWGSGLDLTALSTIGDIQPLLGPNRSFAKFGLTEISKTMRVGLQELINVAGLFGRPLGTYEVGWLLTPRLNAPGRVGDALDSLRLLLTTDLNQARDLAIKLNDLNQERQAKLDEMVEHAKRAAESLQAERKVTIVSHADYHEGVIGLLAGKLVEEFYRPAVALARGAEFSKGSARSINGFNIIEALRGVDDLLESVGGHPMAAGFTIRTARIEEFVERFLALADGRLDSDQLRPTLVIDQQLPLSLVTEELWGKLREFEPFGSGNPQPTFLSGEVGVLDVITVGNTGSHLKLQLQDLQREPSGAWPATIFTALGFGMGGRAGELRLGDRIEVAYQITENNWNNHRSLELRLRDLRPSTV